MTDYYAEKSQQVQPNSLTAFGVAISSRYGRADELIEMLRFAEHLANANVSGSVRRVFYDSKMGMCTFELDSTVIEGDAVAAAILDAATRTIRQFDWFGTVEYGDELAEYHKAQQVEQP